MPLDLSNTDYLSIALATLAGGAITYLIARHSDRDKRRTEDRRHYVQAMVALDELEARFEHHHEMLSVMVKQCQEDPANAPYYMLHTLRQVPTFPMVNQLIGHLHELSRGEVDLEKSKDFQWLTRMTEQWRFEVAQLDALFSDADKTFVHATDTAVREDRLNRIKVDVAGAWGPTIKSFATVITDCRELRAAIRDDYSKL